MPSPPFLFKSPPPTIAPLIVPGDAALSDAVVILHLPRVVWTAMPVRDLAPRRFL